MNEARSWSQAGLYWVTAAVLGVSAVMHLHFKGFTWELSDLVVVFAAIGLLGLVSLGFFSLSSPHNTALWARRLVLGILVVYGLVSCAALSVMSVLFFLPQPFLAYGLPLLLLFTCYRYTTHLTQATPQAPQPFWAWLAHTSLVRDGVWIIILLVGLFFSLIAYILIAHF